MLVSERNRRLLATLRQGVERYDSYLKRKAEALSPSARMYEGRTVALPWAVAAVGSFATTTLAGVEGPLLRLLAIALSFVFLLCGLWAGIRLAHHGWRHDRTISQAWAKTPEGQLLQHHLELTSLAELSKVTRDTEIFYGLGLWGADLVAFLEGLAKDCGVPALPIGQGPFAPGDGAEWVAWLVRRKTAQAYRSLTVGRVLDAVAAARVATSVSA